MPMQRVIECVGANNAVIKRWVNNRAAQRWIFDPISKTIRNRNWTSYVLSQEGANLRCRTMTSRWFQLFKWRAPFLHNEKENTKVADVQSALDTENRQILMVVKHGKLNQQWDVVYKKDWKGEPGTGQWNRDFGMIVNKDMHIISALGSGRYIDFFDGRNMVIKTQNGRRTQLWYFHQHSRTVRNRYNNQSFDIHNKGKGTHMQVYSTSSNWW
jgi:hypothetical protein